MKSAFIWVVLYYIRFFARLAIKINRPVVIGVTGSAGKSSLRNALTVMLLDYFPTKVIEKGNSETGIPLGILGLSIQSLGFQTPLLSILDWLRIFVMVPFSLSYLKGIKYLVVEMGIDEPFPPKNMGFLLSIVKPEIAVFLNVYPVHTMQFDVLFKNRPEGETVQQRLPLILEAIGKEKGKIITESGCRVAIYNGGDPTIRKIIQPFKEAHMEKTFATFDESNDDTILYKEYSVSTKGTRFSFELTKEQKLFEIKFSQYVLPKEYREVFAAAVLVGLETGLTVEQITQSLEKNYRLPKSRASAFAGIKNSVIIDSSYNASKRPVLSFVELAYTIKKSENRPFVFVFGDMRELGEESQFEHEEVAKQLIGKVDELYCVGEQTQKFVLPIIKQGVSKVQWFENSVKAGEYLKNNLSENAIVLVKGSQNTIFLEEAVKQILQNPQDASRLCRQEDYWLKKKLTS